MRYVRLMRMTLAAAALWACATAHAQLLEPEAQAFSFQAKLTGVSDGPHELHITLYDAEAGGGQVGAPIVITATVQNGIVSEQFPIGDISVFDEGQRLWAEVSVDNDPPLSPRIPLIAVPYSFRVHQVGSVELDDDVVLGSAAASGSLQLYDDQGAVVITLLGTGDPAVDVTGTVRMTGFVMTSVPGAGLVLTSDANGLGTWQPPSGGSGFWSANGNDIYNNNAGNVGIGMDQPLYPLHLTAETGVTLYTANTAQSGATVAVYGRSNSSEGYGVMGAGWADSGTGGGVYGVTGSSEGRGVYGTATNQSGTNYGVYGRTYSSDGYAGYFKGGRNYFEGKVGIGTESPGFPLNFESTVGDKISLWGESGDHYGFGIQAGLMQIHTPLSADDIAFGYGSSSNLTETMRIKGNGRVGIGTTQPDQRLHVHNDTLAVAGFFDSTAAAWGGSATGVVGWSRGESGFGVIGSGVAASGTNVGVLGNTNNLEGTGVKAVGAGPTGTAPSKCQTPIPA